jgi:hypothetical protein
MSYYDCDETDRAVAAYFRRGERHGWSLDQPNRSRSGIDENNVVTLRNGGGVLARYKVADSGRLRRLALKEDSVED